MLAEFHPIEISSIYLQSFLVIGVISTNLAIVNGVHLGLHRVFHQGLLILQSWRWLTQNESYDWLLNIRYLSHETSYFHPFRYFLGLLFGNQTLLAGKTPIYFGDFPSCKPPFIRRCSFDSPSMFPWIHTVHFVNLKSRGFPLDPTKSPWNRHEIPICWLNP